MAVERVLRMKGGVGETSYANNSLLQRKVIMKVKTIFEDNLELMISNTTFDGCCKVADLGCSSGPNTLVVISNILNFIAKAHKPTVFQIYLNDLFENDFNAIFKLLPDFYESIQQDNVGTCFINATPGTFFGRLYPNNYINFFHSSYSIHWLSQAPKGSTKKGEPINKGNIHITRTSSPSVYHAYLKQFERDFKCFLESRFEELTYGGVMVLTFIVREKAYEIAPTTEVLSMALSDMAQEGLVEEEKIDLFNLPIYYPTIEEVGQVIKAEKSFTVQLMKTFKIGWDADLQEDIADDVLDSKIRGEFIAKYHRAIFEPLLIAEFGENIVDELFSRYAKMAAQIVELETPQYTNIVLFLTKNENPSRVSN